MATLSLFRHAKSAWDNSGLSDFERPLAPRGERAAPRMGRYMAEEDLIPELVLCSSAVRARQTYELASEQWSDPPECLFEDGLYMASPERMLSFLSSVSDSCSHVMIVAHNPGMHALAASLADAGDTSDLVQLREKFPTAALAVFDIAGSWAGLGASNATLERFVVPRSLD